MKKILIALVFIFLAAAALPIIGNSVMQSTIDERVEELSSYGLKSKNEESKSSYFTTKKHFEFLLEDADEFVNYLNQYADQQIPPYVNAMLEGVVVGADLEYSNVPFSKDIKLDIYPLTMSPKMAESLKEKDVGFHSYLEKFLHSKGVLYHINYNIVSEDFNGFVKDMDEKYTLKDGTILTLLLKDTSFEGNGQLIAPDRVTSKIKTLNFDILKAGESMKFNLANLKTSTSYESKTTYVSGMKLKDFNFVVHDGHDDVTMSLKNVNINASSNTQGEFAELNTKSGIANLSINSKKVNLEMDDFNMDIALNSIDKASYEESVEVISQMRANDDELMQKKLQASLETLLAKGLVLNIADFSLEGVTMDSSEDLKGFKVQSKLTLKEDKDFAQKLKVSPLLLVSNIEILTKIRVSQKIYAKLTKERPIPPSIEAYMKEDGEDYIFDIDYVDGVVTINGKTLQ